MNPRRIVTGLDGEGRSVFTRVEELPQSSVGAAPVEVFRVWGTDALPVILPTDGRMPQIAGASDSADLDRFIAELHPEGPEHGLRIGVYTFAPGGRTKDMVGLHWHDTVDVFFMIDGELALYGDDGKVIVRRGDCIVVNGTNHVFDNESSAPSTFGLVSLGGRREGASPPRRDKLDWTAERGYHFPERANEEGRS